MQKCHTPICTCSTCKLDKLMASISGLTELEYAQLAMLCIDQAGLPVTDQARIAQILAKRFPLQSDE